MRVLCHFYFGLEVDHTANGTSQSDNYWKNFLCISAALALGILTTLHEITPVSLNDIRRKSLHREGQPPLILISAIESHERFRMAGHGRTREIVQALHGRKHRGSSDEQYEGCGRTHGDKP